MERTGILWLANTSYCRCFYVRCVTSGDLTQPTLNQSNSGGLAEAPRCNVCRSGLLSRAAFKGHVFRCLRAPRRAPRTFITNLQLKRAEPEQPHFPLRAVKTRRGISGWACCVCTPRNSELCWNEIRYSQSAGVLEENKRTSGRLSFGYNGQALIAKDHLCKRMHVHTSAELFFSLIWVAGSAVSCFGFFHTRRQLCYQHGVSAWHCKS